MVAATVSVAHSNSGQCFGWFSGGNAQEWTNFGHHPKAFS